jgi:L-alanine-DL-glutamate epimerase-like enolase superfamily enzyme
MRSASAVDIALWDLLGKATNRPICDLLGGASRTAVPVYNTCAGYTVPGQPVDDQNLIAAAGTRGTFNDLAAWQDHDAGELAGDLLAQGITAMKMWPFDAYARMNGGTRISEVDLARGLEPYRQVRSAVGGRMDLLLELHGLWNLSTALRIAQAFEAEGIRLFWIEDPVLPDDIGSLARFAAGTSIPTAASELLGGRQAFRELAEARAANVVIFEMCWCGGISEGKAIATLADAFGLPIAPHDGTGPVGWAAGVHLAINAPNTLIQESVRAFYTGWYANLVTQLPRVENGFVRPPAGPGLGLELQPGTRDRRDAHVRTSSGSIGSTPWRLEDEAYRACR